MLRDQQFLLTKIEIGHKIEQLLVVCILSLSLNCFGQISTLSPEKNSRITQMIETLKADPRGPYQDIRWFCYDGTTKPPKEPCADGGVQRARYKPEILTLGKQDHVFLGQILATTDHHQFWDADHQQSRLKQYQLEKWLKSVDNGWINRKAQYYRGAVQAEDEQAWGKEFLMKTLTRQNLTDHFYLIREAAKDIPHRDDDNVSQLMRSQSKAISDAYDPFLNLRIKIHNQPEVTDIERVRQFKEKNNQSISPQLNTQLDQLILTMERFFQPPDIGQITQLAGFVTNEEIRNQIETYINGSGEDIDKQLSATAELMWSIREKLLVESASIGRLALLDLSILLERLLMSKSHLVNPTTLNELLETIVYLSKACAATGYLEIWEWNQIKGDFPGTVKPEISIGVITSYLESTRRVLEWSTGMCKAEYGSTVKLFENFEPKSVGFIDDRVRGSVALTLGNYLSMLGDFTANHSAIANKVFKLSNQSHIRGLNPGYAMGILNVVTGSPIHVETKPDHIYIFEQPPPDLKPVAGIATVSEGNLVSHVQLLARNLGIPNAGISLANLSDLEKYHGLKVFYAVSPKGNVIMKEAKDMTAKEQSLFVVNKRSEEKITVPVDKIDLNTKNLLNLASVRAQASGQTCGPKAANLGELKALFPEHVVEGLVIPFGTFFDHMQQLVPGGNISYWSYLMGIFQKAREMASSNEDPTSIETFQLKELAALGELIRQMPLKEAFQKDLADQFNAVFGRPLGEIGVFLRSDTNMEDLKDFSGAGLNLTLFNVVDRQEILEGIKRVWASPYTERSFKWRQSYLLNPENVYPSILIIPSVNNDHSGVMITKNVINGNPEEITAAFSKGVGGAVEGQAAETWILAEDSNDQLLAPAREPSFTTLPETGGIRKQFTGFVEPVLPEEHRLQLRLLNKQLKQSLTENGVLGPYDVELGFKDNQLWLFQVRPYVENKRAQSSDYLESISPRLNETKRIKSSTPI